MRGVPKGKPWSVDEEKRLKDLLKSGVSIREAAKAMGKTLESVQVKVLRLGLEVEGGVFSVATTSTPTSLPYVGLDGGKAELQSSVPVLASPGELPTVEEVLLKLAGALANLEKSGLSRSETARCKALIGAAEKYEKLYVDYAKYKSLEGRLVELEGKYFELVKKQQTA